MSAMSFYGKVECEIRSNQKLFIEDLMKIFDYKNTGDRNKAPEWYRHRLEYLYGPDNNLASNLRVLYEQKDSGLRIYSETNTSAYEVAKMINVVMSRYAKKGYFQLDYTNDEIGKGGTIFINSYGIDPHDFSYLQ